MRARGAWLAAAAALGAVLGMACRIPNPEHCSNQDRPGSEYCVSINPATPYCSPCHSKYHGCLPFPPTSCDGFATGDSGGDGDGSSSSGTTGGT
ncbi:MAG: hypothetical protein IPH07_01375 [Deltaproteobacteria bacterium]|nr:hypothetical protein [Deltaproteobacteria bacterium]